MSLYGNLVDCMSIIFAKSVGMPGISSANEANNRKNALIRKAVFEGPRTPAAFFAELDLFAADWLITTKTNWLTTISSSVAKKNITLSSNDLNFGKSSHFQTKKINYVWLFEHFSRQISQSSYFLYDYVTYYWQRNFPSSSSLYVKYYKEGGFELMESYVSKNEAYPILVNYIETSSNFNDTDKGYLELLDYTLNKPSVLSALGLNIEDKNNIIARIQELSLPQQQSGKTNKNYNEENPDKDNQYSGANQDRSVFIIALVLLLGVFVLKRFKKKA